MAAKEAFFDVLLKARASFSISQVIVGEMLKSFRCHMYEDKEVLKIKNLSRQYYSNIRYIDD